MDLLTSTSLSTYRKCPRQYWYRYEVGLRRKVDFVALRMGAAYHRAIHLHSMGIPDSEAIEQATAGYDDRPEYIEEHAWEVERETIKNMLQGRFWRYQNDNLFIRHPEQVFQMPVANPTSTGVSRTFALAGKIDAIGAQDNIGDVVVEYKTTGDDIGPDSDYWMRLRIDPQISAYVMAARSLQFPIQTVIYDVARKPSIAPRQIPTLDPHGLKIVVDETGARVFNKDGKPRLSADTEKGWKVLSRTETAAEFGERFQADIYDRPDFYFQRREIPRLDNDLDEFRHEIWQQSQQIIEARRAGRWFRNVGPNTCKFCPFNTLCYDSIPVDREHIPAGYELVDDLHPELQED